MCGPSSHGPGALGYPEWPTYLPAAHTQRRRSGREKRLVCVSCYKSESLAGEIPYLQRATCTRGGVVGLNHECGWTSTTSSTPAGPPAASAPAQTTTTLRRRASTATTKVFSLHLFLTTVLLFIANLQPTSAGECSRVAAAAAATVVVDAEAGPCWQPPGCLQYVGRPGSRRDMGRCEADLLHGSVSDPLGLLLQSRDQLG